MAIRTSLAGYSFTALRILQCISIGPILALTGVLTVEVSNVYGLRPPVTIALALALVSSAPHPAIGAAPRADHPVCDYVCIRSYNPPVTRAWDPRPSCGLNPRRRGRDGDDRGGIAHRPAADPARLWCCRSAKRAYRVARWCIVFHSHQPDHLGGAGILSTGPSEASGRGPLWSRR